MQVRKVNLTGNCTTAFTGGRGLKIPKRTPTHTPPPAEVEDSPHLKRLMESYRKHKAAGEIADKTPEPAHRPGEPVSD